MKKITLKRTNVEGVQLSREQLKKVMGGGSGDTTGPGDPNTTQRDCEDECSTPGDACTVGTFSGVCRATPVANEGCSPDSMENLCAPA